MELIVHIGHEKTGTTSIQDSLVRNKTYLQGLNILISSEFGIGNARSIPATFSTTFIEEFFELQGKSVSDLPAAQKKLKQKLRVYLNKLPRDTKLIFSSEHFASRLVLPEDISEFSYFLNEYFEKITIIIFLRGQAGMMESAYWELLKAGKSKPIPHEPSHEMTISTYFNYYHLLENWLSGFSKEQIQIYNYDYISSTYPSLVDFFYSVIANIFNVEIDFSQIKKTRNANQSPDFHYLEILRLINQKIVSENPAIAMKPWLNGNLLRRSVIYAIQNIAGSKSKIKVNQNAWQLAFQSSNNLLNEKFMVFGKAINGSNESFHPETYDSLKSKESVHNLSNAMVVDLISSLYTAFKTELDQTKTELDQTKTELDQTKTELDQTKTELDQTKTELDQTKTELDQIIISRIWRVTKIWRDLRSID